jgi:glycosyltransferase 2 family protein
VAALLVGLGLLAVVAARADLREAFKLVARVGWKDVALLCVLFAATPLAEAASWLMLLPSLAGRARWLGRLWRLLAVAATLELVTPFGTLSGEPVKAFFLKRRYGVAYRESAASLVLSRTTNVVSLILFVGLALGLMLAARLLPPPWPLAAAASLALLGLGVSGFYLVQRRRGVSLLLAQPRFAWLVAGPGRAARGIDALKFVEDRLVAFYGNQPGRLALSVAFSLGEWVLATAVLLAGARALGSSLSLSQAIVLEGLTLIANSIFFFIPGGLGGQEGAVVLGVEAMLGSASLGLALAAVRRAGELLWAAFGLVLILVYGIQGLRLDRLAEEPAPTGEGPGA